MRFLILLALCVAASQARSTNSGSRMKLLSRVLDFLEERDDEPEPESPAPDCYCPTAEEVVAFLAEHAEDSAEESLERPDDVCPLHTCDGLAADIQTVLGCTCPTERPASGEELPEGTCPMFLCMILNGGPPGGRSGPRGGGSRGPPRGGPSSEEKKRDASYECECRPPPPPGAPPPSGETWAPCPPEDCSGSGPEPEPEDDDKRHARRSHARRQGPDDFVSGEMCLCPCPPDMECEEHPEDAGIPDCMAGECEDERRKSAPRTRALVNLLKSLLHKK